jgi:predicted nucleotidyltransferase component of viral defense system
MKIAAMLSRAKGRDFYDLMFLLTRTQPDYEFLAARCGIHNPQELKEAIFRLLDTVDLSKKQRDFEHLLFHKENSKKILRFREFVEPLMGNFEL